MSFNLDILQLGSSAGVYGTTTGCTLGQGLGQIAINSLFNYGFNTDYSCGTGNCNNNPWATQKSDLTTLGIIGGVALFVGGIVGLANRGETNNDNTSNLRDRIKAKEAEATTELAKVGEGVTRADYETTIDTQIGLLNNQTNIDNQISKKKATRDTANTELDAIKATVGELQGKIKDKKNAIKAIYDECQVLMKNDNSENVEAQINAKKAEGQKLVKEKYALEAQLKEEQAKQTEKEGQIATLTSEIETLEGQKTANAALLKKGLSTDVTELQALKTKLTDIYAEIDTLYEKYLDKADGNSAQQTSNRRFSKLFDTSGEVVEDKKIKDKDIRKAINRFRTAENDTQKQAAADTFRKLWDVAGEDITNNPTFKGAYNLINSMNPEEIED